MKFVILMDGEKQIIVNPRQVLWVEREVNAEFLDDTPGPCKIFPVAGRSVLILGERLSHSVDGDPLEVKAILESAVEQWK